jgi:hypothetical protein
MIRNVQAIKYGGALGRYSMQILLCRNFISAMEYCLDSCFSGRLILSKKAFWAELRNEHAAQSPSQSLCSPDSEMIPAACFSMAQKDLNEVHSPWLCEWRQFAKMLIRMKAVEKTTVKHCIMLLFLCIIWGRSAGITK